MMPNLFDRVFGRSSAPGSRRSGSTAKERLQFVLIHDRIHLPPEKLAAMKEEILAVISKYVSVDNDHVDIALQQRDRNSLLIAEIPFLKTTEGVEKDESETKTDADL